MKITERVFGTFFPQKKHVFIFTKSGLGDFFTNSSGHPGAKLMVAHSQVGA
jgi:hypothetical protein